MRAILPPWTDPDPELHARLGDVIDPDRKVLAAVERIVPLSGKRIADVGTGIGHYPMLLARHTGRTYGDRVRAGAARGGPRACGPESSAQHPDRRGAAGERSALRDEAVDVVLHGLIEADDTWLPAISEAFRVLRPGGRLIVMGYYGRDDVGALLDPEVVTHAHAATQRRTGWWLRHGLQDQGRPRSLRPARRGDRPGAARATLWRSWPSLSARAAQDLARAQVGPIPPAKP